MINVQVSTSFEAVVEGFDTGLVGTAGVRILDNQGATVLARQTGGIIELVPGSGLYSATLTSPATEGQYSVVWDNGSGEAEGFASEDLFVYAAAVFPDLPPLAPIDTDGGPSPGPCTAWTTAEAIAACCESAAGSDTALYDSVAEESSRVLYELSARQFPGVCAQVARPCSRRRCGFQVLSRGHIVAPDGYWRGDRWDDQACGCTGLSRVLLPNYPVFDIVEVLIDGQVLDPTFDSGDEAYRIDNWRWLVRMTDPDAPDTPLLWPSCQRLDLPATSPGTFEVTYRSGSNPPQIAQDAAAELACQMYLACPPNNTEGECQLPSGVTRIERQGVTIELANFRSWAFDPKSRRWFTGLPTVDLFLNTYNPSGLRRRPAVWSPDGPRYADRVGTAGGS